MASERGASQHCSDALENGIDAGRSMKWDRKAETYTGCINSLSCFW